MSVYEDNSSWQTWCISDLHLDWTSGYFTSAISIHFVLSNRLSFPAQYMSIKVCNRSDSESTKSLLNSKWHLPVQQNNTFYSLQTAKEWLLKLNLVKTKLVSFHWFFYILVFVIQLIELNIQYSYKDRSKTISSLHTVFVDLIEFTLLTT